MKQQQHPKTKTTPTRKMMLLDIVYILVFLVGLTIALYMVIDVLISRILSGARTWFDYAMGAVCIIGIGVLI